MRKNFILTGLIGLVVVVGLLFWLLGDRSSGGEEKKDEVRGVPGVALDVALDFYQAWLDSRLATSSDPYALGLPKTQALSIALGEKLALAEQAFKDSGFDPVLCQVDVPSAVRSKTIFENEKDVQIMVLPKGNKAGTQSVVSLTFHDGLWEILDISCSAGEQAPEQGEFSFEQEGFLLKQSIKPPLDNKYWHLVFEQDGVLGHTVPLFIDNAVCLTKGDSDESCNDGALGEVMKVVVKGSMTEAGVDVKRIELMK